MTSLPATYKAFMYKQYGPIADVLELQEVSTEPLDPAFLRIQVHSAAVNPGDTKLAGGSGLLLFNRSPSETEPFRIGFDVAGVVVGVGSHARDKFAIGDAVFAMASLTRAGTIAEFVDVDAQHVALKPRSLDFVQAAAVPLVSLTSYQALFDVAKLQPDERVLVLGGSTSVGIAAIQLAKMVGAYVVATASTSKVAFVASLGADRVIDYTTTKWGEVVETHSLDVVYDCAVEPTAWHGDAQRVLKKDGARFVTLDPLGKGSLATFGATHHAVFAVPSGKQLAEIGALVDAGKLTPTIDSVFPFQKTGEAYARLLTERVVGKVVVQVL